MALKDLLRLSEPFGPVDQQVVMDDDDAALLLDGAVLPFRQAFEHRSPLILGRKGAGKSSVLAGYQFPTKYKHLLPLSESDIPSDQDIVVPIESWQHFQDIVISVSKALPSGDKIIFPEWVSRLWADAIWIEIFKHLQQRLPHFTSSEQARLSSIRSLFQTRDFRLVSPNIDDAIHKMIAAAKASVSNFLAHRRARCYVLFDSMDDYPVRDSRFVSVIAGLLKCLSSFQRKHPEVSVIFCLPEEIARYLMQFSSNIIKDFNHPYYLRWKPGHLLRVAAHRYRLFIQLNDAIFFKELDKLNFSTREDLQTFYQRIMPPDFSNTYGHREDPVAYLIRHTQLQPRHFLMILNRVATESYRETGGLRKFLAKAIQDAVSEAELRIAEQILYPYGDLYPKLIMACQQVLADLPPICNSAELAKAQSRMAKRMESDIFDFRRTLFQMGILGKVEEDALMPENGNQHSGVRYAYAKFYFNTFGDIGYPTDATYCFHPVFSKYFGLRRRKNGDGRFVYPADIGDIWSV
jgi:hypothetical protein